MSRSTLVTGILALMGVCPFVVALLATSRVPAARPLDGAKPLTSLAFRQYAVNLREIPATGRITVPFSFWNRGSGPIEILKLEPSCGCLAPKILGDRTRYEPGGQGLFEVQVDTARETPGPQHYSIKVRYQDTEPREELVTFRLTVPDRSVQVTPSELYFYQVSDAELENEIRVSDHRGTRHLKIVEVLSSSTHLVPEIGTQEVGEEVAVTPIRVRVDGKVPAGAHRKVLSIRTDDADFPVIQIPVFLHGRPDKIELTTGVKEGSPPEKVEARK